MNNKIRKLNLDYKETKYFCKKTRKQLRRFLKRYRNKIIRQTIKNILNKEEIND